MEDRKEKEVIDNTYHLSVKELIKQLKKMPENYDVKLSYSGGLAVVNVEGISKVDDQQEVHIYTW